MGLFDRIFRKSNTVVPADQSAGDFSPVKKVIELLDEDLYWSIIDKSLRNSDNQADQQQLLTQMVGMLPAEQIIGFNLRTTKLSDDIYTSAMWCAGYIMNGGCSDDGFAYFRGWVISRGKETYYLAKQNPDHLIEEMNDGTSFYDFEGFLYIAFDTFRVKTGKDMYTYLINHNAGSRENSTAFFEFTWEESKPETMKVICPRLFEKLWNR